MHIDLLDSADPTKSSVLRAAHRFETPFAAEIFDAIDASAAALAEAAKNAALEKRRMVESAVLEAVNGGADDDSDEDGTEVRLRILKKATVRKASDLDSEVVGSLSAGTVIRVLEAVRVQPEAESDESDVPAIVRVRFAFGDLTGWTR